MSNDTALSAISRSYSILDRASVPNFSLTEVQALTDQIVSTFIKEATDLRTAAAMLGAGWAGRATRIGALSALPGQTILPQLVRGASYVPALAAESAAFAGIERGFHHLEGHPSSQSFQRDWARAAVTLTGLKVFGGLSSGQNIILQHFVTDVGLVGTQNVAHTFGLTDAPHGNLARQMLQAEAMNWQMKGSLAFVHAAFPSLLAAEKSLDTFLYSQEGGLSALGRSAPFSPEFAFAAQAAEGAPTASSIPSKESEFPGMFMSQIPDGKGGPMRGRGSFEQTERPKIIGGAGSAKNQISGADLTRIFRGDEPPMDAHSVSELVQRYNLLEPLSGGEIFVKLEDTSSSSLPTTYSLSLLPAEYTQVFRTLLNVNEIEKWMPRLEKFRIIGNETREFDNRPISQKVLGRFKAGSRLTFQGQFLFDYRPIPGGLQMSWRLHGPQEFPEKDVKLMRINNCSFTLLPVPNRPDQTVFAYNIHVEPDSVFLRAGLAMFLPGAHKNELPQSFGALANRTISPSWTIKDKDPLGLDFKRGMNPSNIQYKLTEL
jgi:hypothetical protein